MGVVSKTAWNSSKQKNKNHNDHSTTKIELQIQNTLEDTSDDSFEMCIPENAIISNFSMTIKDKVYLAKVKTKEDAENIYGYGDRTSGLLQNYNFPDICMDD